MNEGKAADLEAALMTQITTPDPRDADRTLYSTHEALEALNKRPGRRFVQVRRRQGARLRALLDQWLIEVYSRIEERPHSQDFHNVED